MKRRALVAAPLLLALPVLLSGCALANAVNPPVSQAVYATVPDAAKAADTLAIPDWVPADASMIRIKTDLVELDKIMVFTVPAQPLPEGSDPNAAPPQIVLGEECKGKAADNRPQLDDSWWISGIADGTAISCAGDWRIIVSNQQVWAWNPGNS